MKYLTEENLKKYAPSVYTLKPSNSVSSKYSFYPTYKIIDDMKKLEWYPVRALENNVRKDDLKGYQRHMIIFRYLKDLNVDLKVNDLIPEVCLSTSHLGKNSFRFSAGLFRLVCSNGLMVSDETFQSIKIIHKKYTIEQVEDVIFDYIRNLPNIISQIENFKKIRLSYENKIEFIEEILYKYYEKYCKVKSKIDPNVFLIVRREEDNNNDLWTTFNVVQENWMKGGLTYRDTDGRCNKLKEKKSIKAHIEQNKLLWTILLQFAHYCR